MKNNTKSPIQQRTNSASTIIQFQLNQISMKIYILFLIILCTVFIRNTAAQTDKYNLSLDEVVKIASQSSLDAFRYKNMYLASYWEYRYYKADKLPSLNLNTTPLDYNHYRKREYNFQTNEEEYVLRDYFNSDVSVELSQKIGLTGGSLFLNSALGMVKNLGGDQKTSYQATPISIGYSQSLNGSRKLNRLNTTRQRKNLSSRRKAWQ